jgi:predicted site-specific integrase-resolvase
MQQAQQQSDWPKAGTLAEWSRILNISVLTLAKYIKRKRLKATKNLNRSWLITRKAICECFDIEEES